VTERSRTALLVGATGLVGGHCLDRLLAEPRYSRVTVLARRAPERTHHRLEVRVVDFDALGERSVPAVDDVYSCLGTTIRAAGSRRAFRRVDHFYPVTVARLARAGGARRLALVSSIGADPGSRNFSLRTKGETDRDVATIGYECVEIFRPSLLLGERAEPRLGEATAAALSRAGSGLLVGRLRNYRPVRARVLAAAMVEALRGGEPGRHVRTFGEIHRLATPPGQPG
jgi:uncharacterized protein YbjT (DUF2867 family)